MAPLAGLASGLLIVVLALASGLAGGCHRLSPQDRLPEGDAFVGRAAGVRAWIGPLATMQESRLVSVAERLSPAVEQGCEEIEGSCSPGGDCSLWREVACRRPDADLEAAWERLGDWDWQVSRNLAGRSWSLRGRQRADGVLEAQLDLPPLDGSGPAGLLMPAEDGPGATHLGGDGLLAHFRVRPAEGLDVASLIPAEELGAGLFQLQSELFLAAVLAGNWELAVHMPAEGERFPPMSLALDFRSRGPAVAAMNQLLENLTTIWPVRRDPYELAGWQGECLGNLNVLPQLAPCYVATDEALVLGWNVGSLELALSGSPEPLDPLSSSGIVHLERFPEADDRLARAYDSGDERPLRYPWSRALIRGAQVGERFVIDLELTPGGAL